MGGLRRLSRPPQPFRSRSALAGCDGKVEALLLPYIARTRKLALVEKTV
jgi:hypothetical protein